MIYVDSFVHFTFYTLRLRYSYVTVVTIYGYPILFYTPRFTFTRFGFTVTILRLPFTTLVGCHVGLPHVVDSPHALRCGYVYVAYVTFTLPRAGCVVGYPLRYHVPTVDFVPYVILCLLPVALCDCVFTLRCHVRCGCSGCGYHVDSRCWLIPRYVPLILLPLPPRTVTLRLPTGCGAAHHTVRYVVTLYIFGLRCHALHVVGCVTLLRFVMDYVTLLFVRSFTFPRSLRFPCRYVVVESLSLIVVVICPLPIHHSFAVIVPFVTSFVVIVILPDSARFVIFCVIFYVIFCTFVAYLHVYVYFTLDFAFAVTLRLLHTFTPVYGCDFDSRGCYVAVTCCCDLPPRSAVHTVGCWLRLPVGYCYVGLRVVYVVGCSYVTLPRLPFTVALPFTVGYLCRIRLVDLRLLFTLVTLLDTFTFTFPVYVCTFDLRLITFDLRYVAFCVYVYVRYGWCGCGYV